MRPYYETKLNQALFSPDRFVCPIKIYTFAVYDIYVKLLYKTYMTD